MTTLPVRRLGATGVIADTNPYDLEDASTFSAAVNCRFKDGKVTRGPLPRTVNVLDFEPGFSLTIPQAANGVDEIILVEQDFSQVYRVNGKTFEDLTPADWSGTESPERFTSTFLGGVAYLNRFTNVPIYKAPGDSTFSGIPGWNPDWRCSQLVAYKDFLVAIGFQKDGVVYPTMVKWSDLTGFGAPPVSWDATSTTNSAGENIVNEMQHAIVWAAPLRDSLILYCTNSVWTMDYIGGNLLFAWRKLYDACGVINQNCTTQVDGLHYVFDRGDIYVHDGATKKSICDGRVRSFIFDALDFSLEHLCFVVHDPKLSEVRFCYPSADRLVGFRHAMNGCNRTAVYNYANDTWTFYDLPNVTSATSSAIISGMTWEEAGETSWDDFGGAWLTSAGDESRHVLFTGRSEPTQGLTAPRLYGFDLITGGRMTIPAEPEAVKPALLERSGIDLDNMGKPLTQYVRLMAVWPQMSIQKPDEGRWSFGASDVVGEEPIFSGPYTFDPKTENKIDVNDSGKYLAYRFELAGQGDFTLSGFDVELNMGGRR